MKKEPIVIDLFCGIGGLTHGFVKQGIKVIAGIDNDGTCKYAYEKNNNSSFILKDIKDIKGEEIKSLFGKNKIKILVGCAPCQTFSQHTLKKKDREKDERWGLLYEFLRLIREAKPDIVSMENVPQLRKYKVFEDFVDGIKKMGYFVNYKIINCLRYGIPQKRIRLVLLASKKGEINLIPETHEPKEYLTIKDVIGDLPKIKEGEIDKKDPLHRSGGLTKLNKKRIGQSIPGGSWLDWDKELVLKCHRKKKGSTYRSVYGRMGWNKYSPTITTQFYSYGTGRFGHPTQNRAISLREGAILQTFPKNYEFFEKKEDISFPEMGRHIGNAVPVKLGEVIVKSIKKHIEY